MSTSNVYSALVSRFMEIGVLPAAKVQQENVKFLPPTGSSWASLWFLPNIKDVATLGPEGFDELTGVFQIDLNFPQDSGRKLSQDIADVVESNFTSGTKLAYSGQEVTVTACGRSQGRNVNGSFRVPITVGFRALVARPLYPLAYSVTSAPGQP